MANLPVQPSDLTADSTLQWVSSNADSSGLAKPMLMVRTATDANWILEQRTEGFGTLIPRLSPYNSSDVDAKIMMNAVTPGMRIPHIMSWSTDEQIDSLVHTAQFEALNVLQVTKTTSTLTSTILGRAYNPIVRSTYVNTGVSVIDAGPIVANGSHVINGQSILETDVLYRIVNNETFTVNSIVGFPDPRVPYSEADVAVDPTKSYWTASSTGAGAFFIMIDNEVMRVVDWNGATTFSVPPGGRGVNGVIEQHNPGATIYLLGFEPSTGQYQALGYLTARDWQPFKSMLRPGVCLVSYEGWGDGPAGAYKKVFNKNRNYNFTGYWFVKGQESNLGEDGVPRIQVNLASAGYIYTEQKISFETIHRAKNTYGSWANTAFDEAGISRNIPGDWVDYNHWNPENANAYPLQIKTEYAQHKAYMDHMSESDFGRTCEFCNAEWRTYVQNHKPGVSPVQDARAVGKHIYTDSIRVYDDATAGGGAGPINTYLRLMAALAVGCWETPLEGSPLGQRFSMMPTRLFDNLRTMTTTIPNFLANLYPPNGVAGSAPRNNRVWNGQLSFTLQNNVNPQSLSFPWTNTPDEDMRVYGYKVPVTCPFDATYDKQEFSAPMQDFADVNKMTLQITRDGYLTFIPQGMKLRGLDCKPDYIFNQQETTIRNGQFSGDICEGEWFLSYGQSLSNYSHQFDPSQVLTITYVSGSTAFDVDFSVASAGTGFHLNETTGEQELLWFSPKVGNKLGLQMTGGVQQIDTISLDNLVLGLDWNTNPVGWSVAVVRNGQAEYINALPTMYTGAPPIQEGTNHRTWVRRVQRFVNFLLSRFYIDAIPKAGEAGKYIGQFSVNGSFGPSLTTGVKSAQKFLNTKGQQQGWAGTGSLNASLSADGIWGPQTYRYARKWAEVNSHYLRTDIFWYVQAGYDWDYYVSAILGIKVPERRDDNSEPGQHGYTIDQLALQVEQIKTMRKFTQQVINFGNKAVDDSINKASVRALSTNLADPRIELGDVIWCEVPGFLSASNEYNRAQRPFNNGVYITGISRSMDLTQNTYTAQYSGYRYSATHAQMFKNTNNYNSR